MKYAIYLIIILFDGLYAYSQSNIESKRNQSWYISSGGRINVIDFSNASSSQLPLIDSTPNQNLNFLANRSFINDTNGKLLFYSNGAQIFDSTYNLMLNGDSITPNYNTYFCFNSGVTILPKPGNDSLYYVFTVSSDTPCVIIGAQYVYYSIVNMKANSGKGEVISKANLILSSGLTSSGFLIPVRHGNGRDWWISIKDFSGNGFYRLLLTPDTIISYPVYHVGIPFLIGDSWQTATSSLGDKIAFISSSGAFTNGTTNLSIYDFDRCEGKFINPIQYSNLRHDTDVVTYSVAFSPNGKFLYWSNMDTIFQYNLLTNSFTHVAIFDSTNIDPFYSSLGLQRQFSFNSMELGPDGRIYVGTLINKLHYIDKPNLAGIACDVHQNAILCPNGFTNFLFNVPFFYTPPLSGSNCDTLTSTIDLTLKRNIKIYPNPSDDKIIIESDIPFEDVKICNFVQATLFHQNFIKTIDKEIDITKLKNGLYILIIDGHFAYKFVKK